MKLIFSRKGFDSSVGGVPKRERWLARPSGAAKAILDAVVASCRRRAKYPRRGILRKRVGTNPGTIRSDRFVGSRLIRPSKLIQEVQGSIARDRDIAQSVDTSQQSKRRLLCLESSPPESDREAVTADGVADVYKQVAKWIGLSEKHFWQISEIDVRVGATQDLVAINI